MQLLTTRLTKKVMVCSLYCTLTLISIPASPWGLKTHLWVGQQVVQDVVDDGAVTILGRSYAIPPHVVDAIRFFPDRYLMGHLGPDVFPDPIVGQTTVHPGVEHGWQTDQWVQHLLRSASSAEEVAFAYGFAGHASGDIFAHTYVNSYAGAIFELTNKNSGSEVERRHFVLEKYIEGKTPPVPAGLATATTFARDKLIFDSQVFKEYGRVGTAHHLRAMYLVRESVINFERDIGNIHSQLTTWGADYLKAHARLTIDLATAKHAVQLAEGALKAEEEALKLMVQVYDFAKNRLAEVQDIVKRNPELVTFNEQALLQATKRAAEAVADAARIAAEVVNAINSLENTINGLADKISNLFCDIIGGVLPECDELRERISNLRDQISGQRQRKEAAEALVRETAAARDQIREKVDSLKQQLDTAAKGIADGTYEGAVRAAELDIKLQQELLAQKQKALEEAKKVQQRVEAELNKVIPVVDQIKEAADRYNPITLALKNWLNDIDIAAEEYVKTSHRASQMMLNNNGSPLDAYKEWFDCYGQVFMAEPRQIGQAGCLLKKHLEDIKNEVDRAIDGLPELIRWLVFPSREITKRAEKELRGQLEKGGVKILAFLTSPTTADFLMLLANPENATREKLTLVFREDKSKLRLIRFDDVAALVDRDLALDGGQLNPAKFAPLNHSVILAKLSLLGPDVLNQLVADLVPSYDSPHYAAPLYRSSERNFSLLIDAVRNIDGNHQWQAYGLPYPRRAGVPHAGPKASHYGHDYFTDHSKGLRIFVDPFLRERVFLKLFPASALGVLGERKELRWPAYRFPECPANPFPSTQDARGVLMEADRRCVDSPAPDQPMGKRPFANAAEYGTRYFWCDRVKKDVPTYATIVASPRSRSTADRFVDVFTRQFPDMQFDVHRPVHGSNRWAVMAARCATKELSAEAKSVAMSRGIAHDAYVVYGRRN
ncbi:MAG: hypothetical protein ACOH2B_05665 [Burkholderiaceae bacterium]